MKKFIEMLFGAKQHANARNIRGKKSNGSEDVTGYNHWRVFISKNWLGSKYDKN